MQIRKSIEFYDKLPNILIAILIVLNENYEAYIVGGSCRNFLLKLPIKDFDITTSATPQQVKKALKNYNIIDTGIDYGTITIVTTEGNFEITTYRSEEYANMDRKPSIIAYEKNVINDLERRDFTINTILYDIKEKAFKGYYQAFEDIKNKKIKSIISPEESYRRDPLRILRAIRFACTLGFGIDSKDINFIKNNCALLLNISQERITEEFNKILMSDYSLYSLDLLYETGILNIILPEVALIRRFRQNNPYHWDYYDTNKTLWEHTLLTLAFVSQNNCNLEVRLAALFHDIGKPYCITVKSKDYWAYYGHAEKSAEITEQIMRRMKYSNQMISSVVKLVKYHDFAFTDNYIIKKKLVKKLLNLFDNNEQDIKNWRYLKNADILAHSDYLGVKEKFILAVNQFDNILFEIREKEECFSLKKLAVNGNDIVALGYKDRIVGKILNDLLEQVIEEKLENDKIKLIEFVVNKYKLVHEGENITESEAREKFRELVLKNNKKIN